MDKCTNISYSIFQDSTIQSDLNHPYILVQICNNIFYVYSKDSNTTQICIL